MLNFLIEWFDFFLNINYNDKEDFDFVEMVEDLLVLVLMKKFGFGSKNDYFDRRVSMFYFVKF